MSQAFYRKWRPQRWEQVVGQEHVVQTLQNAVSADRLAHAYLFAGPRGTGKTTTARLLAKAANCLAPELPQRPCDTCEHCLAVNQGRFLDLIEIDAASNTSVEDVRDLRDKINFSPNQAKFKVYIIDEVHMLSTAAFNALLKTLEEPPAHAIFVLATTEVHKIPPTVLSRCQRHEFRRIPVATIVSHLKEMAAGERIQVHEDALTMVARQATGSLRDAISLLDQLASTGNEISLEMAQTILGTAANQAVLDLVDAILKGEPAAGLEYIHQSLDAGSDPRQFARQIVEYLRSLLLVRMNNADQVDAGPEVRVLMAQHARAFSTPDLLEAIRVFNVAAGEARLSWQPALPLEMAFVEALEKIARRGDEPVSTDRPSARGRRVSPAVPEQEEKEAALQATPAPAAEDPEDEGDAQGTGVTLEMVMQQWRKVSALVREQNPQTQGLLNSCKPLGMKNGALVLGFNSDFSRAKMEKAEHRDVVQQVLAEIFNVEVPVRCIVAPGKKGSPPPDIDGDGMVATALRDLGGEIVDIQ